MMGLIFAIFTPNELLSFSATLSQKVKERELKRREEVKKSQSA